MKETQDPRLSNDQMLKSLREQKEHNEKQVEKLLDHFYQQDKYTDELRYFGDKYQQRIKEFETLQYENEQLKYELGTLRRSIDLKLLEDDLSNRLSIDRGKVEASSRMGATNTSAREEYKLKLDQINKLKEQARTERSKESVLYDELVLNVYKFLEQAYSTQNLRDEVKESAAVSSDEQMVLVPKRRYELLIEIYSINMANINAKQFQKHLENSKAENKGAVNFVEESEKTYKTNYGQIMKDTNFTLSIFFKRLAQKFGYEKEWERYHTENENQGVKLKNKIEAIINRHAPIEPSAGREEKAREKVAQSITQRQMLQKLTSLVNQLGFSAKQKEIWSQMSEKFKKDELFDMSKLVREIYKVEQNKNDQLIQQVSNLTIWVLRECFISVTKFLMNKYSKNEDFLKIVEAEVTSSSIQNMFKDRKSQIQGQGIWQGAKTFSKQKVENVLKKFKKHFIFSSTAELYKKVARRE